MERSNAVIFPFLVRGDHLRAFLGSPVDDVPASADVTVCSDGSLMIAVPGHGVITARTRLSEGQLLGLHAYIAMLATPASD